MRLAAFSIALALAGDVSASGIPGFSRSFKKHVLAKSSSKYANVPFVPTYNISMPRDHFSSDTATYQNRYAVNDTYYKPGGPVIILHFGEGAMDESGLAENLAAHRTISAPLQLAEKLNGLVIGWEHRYYGLSQPVSTDGIDVPPSSLDDYKYLTLDQALEDVVYFANNINTTTLELNDNIQDTTNLDPYHTPWLSLGASYPGSFSTWLRQKHPEIIYASWASSAPVQTQADGSIYFNPIYRSLPKNCTDDVQAVFSYVDDVLTSGSDSEVRTIKAGAYLSIAAFASSESQDLDPAYAATSGNTVDSLSWFTAYFQDFGPTQTTQVFCDYMESFDVEEYLADPLLSSSDISLQTFAALNNSAGAVPSDNGIVASQSQDGQAIGFAAFISASLKYQDYAPTLFDGFTYSTQLTPDVDAASWGWQTFSQMGYFQYHNTSDPANIGSKFQTENETNANTIAYDFPDISASELPDSPNVTDTLSYGGWAMQPTNIMFTNGEFDPWRAFSVASQEYLSGAPQRTMTQEIPKCNEPVSGTDVFGIVYPGAVHGEDMSIHSYYTKGSIDTANPPLYQGLDLFVAAYNAWLPCFNTSRDSVRNGQAPPANSNNGTSSNSDSGSSSSSNSKNAAASSRNARGSFAALTVLAISFLTIL